MVLWFVGPSILIVWAVFRSPAADYRLVALGSVHPARRAPVRRAAAAAQPDRCARSPSPLVMFAARGQRLAAAPLARRPDRHAAPPRARRRLDRHRTRSGGRSSASTGRRRSCPSSAGARSTSCSSSSGAAACWWLYRRFRLDEPERRAEFLRTGRVGRDIVPG